MALRIGSIIVPTTDNSGKSLDDLHKNVEAWLCSAFGGFTAQMCVGAWVDNGKRYDDQSVRYDVHYHDRSDQAGWVREVAQQIMANSDQLAVAIILGGCPSIIRRRIKPRLTKTEVEALDAKRRALSLDIGALRRAIARASDLRPANGGRSGANDAVLGLRISIQHLADEISQIEKELEDDRKNT